MWFWWLLYTTIFGGIIALTILGKITKDKISDVVRADRARYSNALYAKITEIQPNVVSFSTYTINGQRLNDYRMKSSFSNVDYRIKQGDIIL